MGGRDTYGIHRWGAPHVLCRAYVNAMFVPFGLCHAHRDTLNSRLCRLPSYVVLRHRLLLSSFVILRAEIVIFARVVRGGWFGHFANSLCPLFLENRKSKKETPR